MRIVDLERTDAKSISEVAEILKVSFLGLCPDFELLEDAMRKVRESFDDHQISRIALDDKGSVIGWVGGISQYNGNVWEIDPLVVRKDSQKRGVGKALVEDFEQIVAQKGAHTIWLGTDDENGRTSLSEGSLYPDVLDKARKIEDKGGHPFGFYKKIGFEIVGVLPDANGPGKPDIFMAKRVKAVALVD